MKVIYFDLYGRAEPIRMMLAKAGVEFEDKRVTHAEWPELQPTLEYGSMPVLELDDGTQLTQTLAITNYVAMNHGFMPADAMGVYEAANIYSFVNDDFFKHV